MPSVCTIKIIKCMHVYCFIIHVHRPCYIQLTPILTFGSSLEFLLNFILIGPFFHRTECRMRDTFSSLSSALSLARAHNIHRSSSFTCFSSFAFCFVSLCCSCLVWFCCDTCQGWGWYAVKQRCILCNGLARH